MWLFKKKKKIEKRPLNLMDAIAPQAYPWSPRVVTIKKNLFTEKWEDISHLEKKEINYYLLAMPNVTRQFVYGGEHDTKQNHEKIYLKEYSQNQNFRLNPIFWI